MSDRLAVRETLDQIAAAVERELVMRDNAIAKLQQERDELKKKVRALTQAQARSVAAREDMPDGYRAALGINIRPQREGKVEG